MNKKEDRLIDPSLLRKYRKANDPRAAHAIIVNFTFPSIFEESDEEELPYYQRQKFLRDYPTGEIDFEWGVYFTKEDYMDFLAECGADSPEEIAKYGTAWDNDEPLAAKVFNSSCFNDFLQERYSEYVYPIFVEYWEDYNPDDCYDPDVWY